MGDAHGVEKTIPCEWHKCGGRIGTSPTLIYSPPSGDKDKIGNVMFQMLEKKREHYLGSGDLLAFRLWTALTNSVMQGLTHNHAQDASSSAQEFLALYRFESAQDEENRGSGYTPLVFASMSGNLPVVRELIESRRVDVRARVRVDLHDLGAEKGMDALAFAAGACAQRHVHDIVAALLAAGADPNAASVNGSTPLMAAIGYQNLGGVSALLACDKVDLEKGLTINRASPLNVAGFVSTYEILKALIGAGANTAHKHDNGGFVFGDICQNVAAQPEWLSYVSAAIGPGGGRDLNIQTRARTTKWRFINLVFRTILRLGISRSDLVMGLGYGEQSTGERVYVCGEVSSPMAPLILIFCVIVL